jgi:hypothetical protein
MSKWQFDFDCLVPEYGQSVVDASDEAQAIFEAEDYVRTAFDGAREIDIRDLKVVEE